MQGYHVALQQRASLAGPQALFTEGAGSADGATVHSLTIFNPVLRPCHFFQNQGTSLLSQVSFSIINLKTQKRVAL